MITRSNLAEQLREYQLRSKHDWASVSFFSSTSNLPSSSRHAASVNALTQINVEAVASMSSQVVSLPPMEAQMGEPYGRSSMKIIFQRVDVVIFVIWELVILALLVFSAVSLYFRHMRLAFTLLCITMLFLLCMKITKQVRLARKKKRRMLLPLSM